MCVHEHTCPTCGARFRCAEEPCEAGPGARCWGCIGDKPAWQEGTRHQDTVIAEALAELAQEWDGQ